jgi:putative hemolysin
MDLAVYIVIVVVCLILSGFFSGSETALLRLTKERVDEDIEKKSQLSIMAARELIKTPAKLLVTILLGNNVVNILGASCASVIGVALFGEKEGLIISTLVMTVVVLIFSEILPKSIAAKNPAKVSYLFAMPLYIIHRISAPFHFIYAKVIDPIVKILAGTDNVEEAAKMSIAESVLRSAETLNANKNDGTPIPIIRLAAKAGNLLCEDIMIPRADLFALPETMLIKDAVMKIANSKFSRVLVYSDSIDDVTGSVHLKNVVRAKDKNKTLKSIAKQNLMVPEKMLILEVFPKMQKSFMNIAVVIDSIGVTKGMVTQEDILEEIVGEIRDEFDKEELLRIKKTGLNKYLVLGKTSVHDFNKETNWDLPGERGESIGDLFFNKTGSLPQKDDVINLDGFQLKVVNSSEKRKTQIEIYKGEEFVENC